MTLELTCPPGTWQPPTYPELQDKAWRRSFKAADISRRTDIANMWCWRFEVETKNSESYEILHIVSSATTWLRDIKPYVTREQEGDSSPHLVLPRLIDSAWGNVPRKNVEKLNEQLDILFYGEPDERIRAIHRVATGLGMFTNKRSKVPYYVMTAAQNAAWNALNSTEHSNKELSTAVKLSTRSHTYEESCDPRGKAWATIASTFDKQDKKVLGQALAVIRDMPTPVVIEGLLYLCNNSALVKMEKDDHLSCSISLVPEGLDKPHLYDALAHFVPKYKGWWQAAHAMGEPVDDAIKRVLQVIDVKDSLDKNPVELPHTLSP